MAYQTVSIRQKIPWSKIGLVLVLMVLAVVVVYFVIPGAAAAIGAGLMAVAGYIVGFFGWMAIPQVAVAALVTAGVFILITQRKYFFRKKMVVAQPYGAAAPLQSQLQGNTLFNNPGQVDVKLEENKA